MEPWDDLLALVLKPAGDTPVRQPMLLIDDQTRGIQIARAAGPDVSPAHGFRTGSITKPFTATLVFQLIEEQMFGLDDCLWNLLAPDSRSCLDGLHLWEGRDWTEQITVRHLLEHRSGLCDFAAHDERFFQLVMAHPDRSWSWQQSMAQYFEYGLNRKALFAPGAGFHYSDTNYLLLALLAEEMRRQKLADLYDSRIWTPLRLPDTFLEFFQPAPAGLPIVYPYYGPHTLEGVNTSFDWGAGGLVSTMADLNRFIRALLAGELFNKASTLRQMLDFKPADSLAAPSKRTVLYGSGLQQKTIGGLTFTGHGSAYGAMLFYNPERDLTIVLALHQAAAMHKAEWLLHKVVDKLS